MRRCVLPVALLLVWTACSTSTTAQAPPAELDFRAELERIAAKCDELGLAEQAGTTRQWYLPRAEDRQYLFIPPAVDPRQPAEDAPQVVQFWYQRFRELRNQQAAVLFERARQAVASDSALAYRLLHEVLRENPDHAEAREILGYRFDGRQWRLPDRRPRPRVGTGTHPLLGWSRGKYWIVETEHFRVTSNHSAQAARQVADELEAFYAVWRQVFFPLWSTPDRLSERFQGRHVALGRDHQYEVVLFRSRDDYVQQLSAAEPQIGITVGYYAQTQKMSFFYVDDNVRTTWWHEGSHQFLQESLQAGDNVGSDRDFWIVEAIALYMESAQPADGYWTVGGVDARRLQFARYRARNEKLYLALQQLVSMGRTDVQQHPDIRRLYSQCAGLAHFLMDGEQARHRPATMQYLRDVYLGAAATDRLQAAAALDLQTLDDQYMQFLNVTDADLAALPHPADAEQLCLGYTDVSDAGLSHLADATRLKWVDLAATATGDQGLGYLRQNVGLTQLNLEKTRITDQALAIVAQFGELEELDLSGTAVTDDGLRHLGKLSKLTTLWLVGTQVSDAGLQHLQALTQLETLHVDQTAITASGLEQLKQRLPRLKTAE